jgi:hypothetical protein
MTKLRALSLFALFVVLAVTLPAMSLSERKSYLPFVSAQTTASIALRNPGFEEAFREVDGVHELKVAEYWEPWWDAGAARPEYKRADPAVDASRVRTGSGAQQWFNNYATHTAGVYQRVADVPVGTTLALEAWVQAFSSSKDDFSQSEGKYRMRIGIDPYGGMDPESPDVVWSNGGHAIEPYDEYQLLTVETVARSDRVTVFIWGQAEWALKHNNAYVDDVRLIAIGDGTTLPPATGLTEEEVRQIVRDEMAKAVRAWADSLD